MDKIPDEIINSVLKYKEAIKEDLKIRRIFIFGSYAKGNYRPESDIDVCVIADGITNSFGAMLKIAPRSIGIDERIEAVVFDTLDFNDPSPVGILKEIKTSGFELNIS